MSNDIWTYRDVLNHSSLAAKTLHGAGLKKNDVIAIISENRHEFAAVAFGAFYLNAIVAPINVTYTERKSWPSVSLIRNPYQFLLENHFSLFDSLIFGWLIR